MTWQGMRGCDPAISLGHFTLGWGRCSAEVFCYTDGKPVIQLEWAKMQSSEIRLIVPRGLKVLLEGVSRAVVENNPDDIAQYFALYFQELVAFRKGLFHKVLGLKS